MFNSSNINKSEFYISVPNAQNANNVIDNKGNFTYDYKYGRTEGYIQEYVKRVPFSKATLSQDLTERLSKQIPSTFELIKSFNSENSKLEYLRSEGKTIQ
jgi:glutamate racemase